MAKKSGKVRIRTTVHVIGSDGRPDVKLGYQDCILTGAGANSETRVALSAMEHEKRAISAFIRTDTVITGEDNDT